MITNFQNMKKISIFQNSQQKSKHLLYTFLNFILLKKIINFGEKDLQNGLMLKKLNQNLKDIISLDFQEMCMDI